VKSLVLSQPMLLPWLGMFEQVALADLFVFHDDIPLPRSHGKGKSFQTRVQIKTQGGWEWLSLPVDRKNISGELMINEAKFPDQSWRKEHLKLLRNAYRTAPFFQPIFEEIVEPLYAFETDFVGEFCIESMTRLFRHFGLRAEIDRTSRLELPRDLVASPRVLENCKRFGADRYLTGLGALEYIDYDLFEAAGVQIHYMEYAKKPYPQIHGEFNPYVSALDLLFNVGADFQRYFASTARYWKEMDVARETYKRK
jgi:hypothetical protein